MSVCLLSRLVPSNLVEKLTGEDLLEFHQSVVLGINEEDVWSTAVPTNLPLEGYPGAPGTTGGTGGVGGAVGAGATGAMSPEREEPSMPYHCEYNFLLYIFNITILLSIMGRAIKFSLKSFSFHSMLISKEGFATSLFYALASTNC